MEASTEREQILKRRAERRENISQKKMKYRLFNLGVGLDLPLLIITLALVGFGLIMLYSASFPTALTSKNDSYFYIRRQAGFALAGILAMLIISVVDYHQMKKYNIIIYLSSCVLLLLVFVPGISASQGEATRWIDLGFTTLQPSELAKFALVVMLATLIANSGEKIRQFRYGLLPCGIVMLVIIGLVILEKHISATAIMGMIALVVMFIGGIPKKWFIVLGILAIAIGLFLIFKGSSSSYAGGRVDVWLDPFNPELSRDETHQTRQSLYAIGAGQLFGVGLGQSKQKYIYLPEARNDFIFSIVCEELGFIGALIVVLLFVALIWRGITISMNARDKFGSLLGIGITVTIGLQALLNICVVTNAIPNTGISLPFFSYGGTSLLVLLGEMGVLLSISRNSYVEKT